MLRLLGTRYAQPILSALLQFAKKRKKKILNTFLKHLIKNLLFVFQALYVVLLQKQLRVLEKDVEEFKHVRPDDSTYKVKIMF